MESFLEGKGGGLLVVVSLWRILRVVESAFELSDKAIETQIKEIRQQLESLRENKSRSPSISYTLMKIVGHSQVSPTECRIPKLCSYDMLSDSPPTPYHGPHGFVA
ncbi:hypothetical protein SAY86_026012 [Trapa natans]|uniref:Uncharacterized protein n=1 Tax=Trapa natans TaxID=22666 RepID=A0AAN7KF26_TRANT|nr:hypothetical protein SAY86_026012 [Trapa natans]